MVDLTNQQRREAGLDPLRVSGDLMEAAESYAQTMAETDCFGHHCGPVPDQVKRVEQAGYTEWSHLGENVAVGPTTAKEVVEGWMNSPPHRDNILEPDFTEIGVGRATANGRTYWVQEFGTQFGDQ